MSEYNDQLAAVKALLTQDVADSDLQSRYDDLVDLKQMLDLRISQLDNRLHPVESKNLVNTPAFEKIGKKNESSDDDSTNTMMGFLKKK